ncbi:hypothetical protein R8Z50_11040 [Longispora sp. K20-0274]|uniref:hypothetical protein n=1 Tax=Longispora sp. K20-0274 TaxID=3088255 RepID=UPI003999F117
MTEIEIVARTGVGAPVERVVCHPTLGLFANLDANRPVVRVWEVGPGLLRELDVVGGDASDYPEDGWERFAMTPSVAWHPSLPLLLVVASGRVSRWTPEGVSELAGLPAGAAYRTVAFSPDGHTLWATPAADGREASDAVDLETGEARAGRWWDTGVTIHPAGGLVATLCSNQGMTLGMFARVEAGRPASMRMLRQALVLDADAYAAPVFSPDGRFVAVRGNAYVQSLDVFTFPELETVLKAELDDPDPAWSRHDIAFDARGVLWIGTPDGTLLEVDLDVRETTAHPGPGSPVTSLAATATGDLLVATAEPGLVLVAAPGGPPPRASGEAVVVFLADTTEVPDDGDLEQHVVFTDGSRSWGPSELEELTAAEGNDPMWLRHRAAVNNAMREA